MADRPILFSGPMVRALLDGRKTQIRRFLTAACDEPPAFVDNGVITAFDENDRPYRWPRSHAVGDRLWVREAWAQHHPAGVQPGRFSIDGTAGIPGPPPVRYRVIYRADGDPLRVWSCDGFPYRTTAGPRDEIDAKFPDVCSEMPGWTPSIHMPRWASRITDVVTEVRAQRLQDITEDDAIAEGVEGGVGLDARWRDYRVEHVNVGWCPTARDSFSTLWDSINGDGAWAANPWVAAYTFTVHLANIDRMAEG